MVRQNPYNALKEQFRQWMFKAIYRRVIQMFTYPEAKLRESSWNLYELSERTRAAQQLGYEVRLRYVDGEGLRAEYVAKLPDTPWWF